MRHNAERSFFSIFVFFDFIADIILLRVSTGNLSGIIIILMLYTKVNFLYLSKINSLFLRARSPCFSAQSFNQTKEFEKKKCLFIF